MNELALFAEIDPALSDVCPYCGAAVKMCAVDTGTQMRVVPTIGGPYVLDGDVLRFVSNDGHVLIQGHTERRGRKVAKNEAHYASHFYECSKKTGVVETIMPKTIGSVCITLPLDLEERLHEIKCEHRFSYSSVVEVALRELFKRSPADVGNLLMSGGSRRRPNVAHALEMAGRDAAL